RSSKINAGWLVNFLEFRVRQEDTEASGIVTSKRKCPEADGPAILLDNAFADPQTQTRALGGFRGEERLEETLCILWTNADAGIADGDTNSGAAAVPRTRLEDMQPQRAARGHRLCRVPNEVEKHLLELYREA